MKPPLRLLLSLNAFTALAFPTGSAPVLAQEVGVSYSRSFSSHLELPDPEGFETHVLVGLGRSWLGRLSFYRVSDRTSKEGLACAQTAPHYNCRVEEVRTSISLSGLEGGLMRAFMLGPRLRITLGGGASFNLLDGEGRGESGLRADLLVPNGGQTGVLGLLAVALTPYPPVPLRLVSGAKAHWIDFNACSGETPPQYDPFCQSTTFKEVQLGLAFSF